MNGGVLAAGHDRRRAGRHRHMRAPGGGCRVAQGPGMAQAGVTVWLAYANHTAQTGRTAR